MVTTRLLDRIKVTSILAAIGAAGGAVTAIALTFIGNLISGYPVTPGTAVYAWNVGVLAATGAVFGPSLAWSMLRRVPLWRTLTEPALAGLAGSVIAMAVAPSLFPVIAPGAILAAAIRLNHVYRDRGRTAELPPKSDAWVASNDATLR